MFPLNLFYEEPDSDHWFPQDRYLRRLARRVIRGKPRIGGQQRVFLNLRAGLQRLGIPYRVNDYSHLRGHPNELACIIGKPCVLEKIKGRNPIVFGAAVYSHPCEDPGLLTRLPIKNVLVPGDWMRQMWVPSYGDVVIAWPVGIDTDLWRENASKAKQIDFLVYDKVRWEHDRYESDLLNPIRETLQRSRFTFREIRYGFYREEDFHKLLGQCRAMIFLCEHETQGIAYQQALSSGVPVLAWDRGGFWQDPAFYPDRVKFAPVTSVPYWDERCGLKFTSAQHFGARLGEFCEKLNRKQFNPREYILENLTLEKCAWRYVELAQEATAL